MAPGDQPYSMPRSLVQWVQGRVAYSDEMVAIRNIYNRPSRVTFLHGRGSGRSTLLQHLAFADTCGDRVYVGPNAVAGAGTRALTERIASGEDDRSWALALLDDRPSAGDVRALHDLVRKVRHPPLSIMAALEGDAWRQYPLGMRGAVEFADLDEPADPRVRKFLGSHLLEALKG